MKKDSVSDFEKFRLIKRQHKGWSDAEIQKRAEEELKLYTEIAKDEPDNLVSGDMEKIINGEDDEE